MNEHFSAMHKIIYIAKTHHSVIEAKMTEVGMHRSTHMMLTYISSCQTPPPQKEIAEKLSIGHETVRTHVRHIYDKLHVRTRTEAVVKHLKGVR